MITLNSLSNQGQSPPVLNYILGQEQLEELVSHLKVAEDSLNKALTYANQLTQENLLLKAGLQHFTQEEVAEFFKLSVRQLQRYETSGQLIPRRIGRSVIYPADRLLEFAASFDSPERAGDAQSAVRSALAAALPKNKNHG